jgi:hypothetical protein
MVMEKCTHNRKIAAYNRNLLPHSLEEVDLCFLGEHLNRTSNLGKLHLITRTMNHPINFFGKCTSNTKKGLLYYKRLID